MIRFQEVSKRFGSVTAVDAISFEVPKGSTFGYIGPNGAGKTTTIKILAGLISVYEGAVIVGGEPIKNDINRVSRLIGYVPQDAGFQEWRTVEHALHTFAALSGLKGDEVRSKTRDVLDLLGIAEHRKRKVVHLSGGTVQKLRIAQALLHDPSVLVLDEPLSGLDPSSRFEVKRLIKDLKDSGKTIFLSSHILSDIEDAADFIAVLNQGKLLKLGSPEQLREQYRVGTAISLTTNSSAQATELLASLNCVKTVSKVDEHTVTASLSAEAGEDEASRLILTRLLENNAVVRGFTFVEPSLEQVYISLTGGEDDL